MIRRFGLEFLLCLGMLALSGCGAASWLAHPVDHIARSSGKISTAPDVRVSLGQASAICADPAKGYANVTIFVQLINLPAQPVEIVVNGTYRTSGLYGTAVTLDIAKAGIGAHVAEVYVAGYRAEPVTVTWAVYYCAPKPKGELYKPDGSGLKDYCNCPGKEELCASSPQS